MVVVVVVGVVTVISTSINREVEWVSGIVTMALLHSSLSYIIFHYNHPLPLINEIFRQYYLLSWIYNVHSFVTRIY